MSGLNSIIEGDCLEKMADLEDNSIDLILTDPPYFKVKKDAWDRQWDSPEKFIDWLRQVSAEWFRLLKPNGSLYCFTSPKMAARVEVMIGEMFSVIQRITWAKPPFSTKAEMSRKEDLRMFFPSSEAIIFAEHYGADNIAKGEAGYEAKCDKLRGFLFEPLRAYLDGERKRAGIDKADCNVACGFARTPGGMASRHYFGTSQWCLPTGQHYTALQRLFNEQGRRPAPPYEDYHEAPRSRFERDLRADYEYLRADYEDLRRPFSVSADVPYTDVWTFPTVGNYAGKHPCEKPVEMMKHIITASTRPGAVVLDCFAGTGATGEACCDLDRDFILIEKDPDYCQTIRRRISQVETQYELPLPGDGTTANSGQYAAHYPAMPATKSNLLQVI